MTATQDTLPSILERYSGHEDRPDDLCEPRAALVGGGSGRAVKHRGNSGVVRDSQGGVLPGATWSPSMLESGTRVERVTDVHGRYFLPSLRVGTYVITVELTGFRRVVRSDVIVQLGQTLALDFSLEVGGLAEEIRVTATSPPAVDQRGNQRRDREPQVVQIPLNGRNFLALAQLSDAVVIPPGGTRGDALQQAGPLPNVGGQRSGHNITCSTVSR